MDNVSYVTTGTFFSSQSVRLLPLYTGHGWQYTYKVILINIKNTKINREWFEYGFPKNNTVGRTGEKEKGQRYGKGTTPAISPF